ncbi:MAG: leucine-rich repeat protein, partial [Treponema sp.]|nr:leucine-rich repeat protein [Treponema sp.]
TFGGWYSDSGLTTAWDFNSSVTADITLYAKWTVTYNTVADIVTYLSTAPGGSLTDPVPLSVDMTLSAANWTALLTAISAENKYVALDLSACTMSGMTGTPGEFDPRAGGGPAAGKARIVSLDLPDAATSVPAGSFSYSTFWNFNALKTLTGANAAAIGDYAFRSCTSLATISLPAAASIGNYAFAGCSGLTEVSLPAAASIGNYAFQGCTGLAAVSLPETTSIDHDAFFGCTGLAEVSLPKATSIGAWAFFGCTGLTALDLPALQPSLGGSVFRDTNDPAPLTIHIASPGTVAAYTTAWGVAADTAAGGNTGVYGSNHKRIIITTP